MLPEYADVHVCVCVHTYKPISQLCDQGSPEHLQMLDSCPTLLQRKHMYTCCPVQATAIQQRHSAEYHLALCQNLSIIVSSVCLNVYIER